MEGKKKGRKNERKEIGPQIIYETEEALYDYAVKIMDMDRIIVQYTYKIENYLDAARMFDELGAYKDSAKRAKRCRELAEQAKKDEVEYLYQLAVKQKSKAKNIKGFEKASKMLQRVSGYKDANDLIEECQRQERMFKTKKRIRQALKLVLIAICIAFVVWFVHTPSWESAKKQMIEWNSIMVTDMPSQ